jgi:hypothetical protein
MLWISKTTAAINYTFRIGQLYTTPHVMVAKKQINTSKEFKIWDIKLEDAGKIQNPVTFLL